jgi:hypothetical protein
LPHFLTSAFRVATVRSRTGKPINPCVGKTTVDLITLDYPGERKIVRSAHKHDAFGFYLKT